MLERKKGLKTSRGRDGEAEKGITGDNYWKLRKSRKHAYEGMDGEAENGITGDHEQRRNK